MSFLDNLKKLIFGTKVAPAEQAPMRTVPYSASDEQAISISIQSFLRVTNESIEIARKSKNPETKISRLGVARNSLREARKVAGKFGLEIEGFDAAEAEINRVDEAIKTGTPTEISGMQLIEVNAVFSSAARNVLMEATALKKEKKYIEACDKLREAYVSDGAENLMIEDRLRLPMYLQLAGKNDDGWDELNRLNARYTDQFSQPRIANQMRIFIKKESNERATNPVRMILQSEDSPIPLRSPLERTSVKMGELQNSPMPSWLADECRGFEFSATLQLRTPLRVLLRHGEFYPKNDGLQPKITKEPWEGIWLAALETFEEAVCGSHSTADSIELFRRLDVELAAGRTVASHIGPIRPRDYLPFLIAIRNIVEQNDLIENRICKLRETLSVCDWQEFVDIHGGTEKIVEYFFPKFMNLAAGLDTPNRVADASDEKLLGIKGVGRVKLKAIREFCASITENRDKDRLDRVLR